MFIRVGDGIVKTQIYLKCSIEGWLTILCLKNTMENYVTGTKIIHHFLRDFFLKDVILQGYNFATVVLIVREINS